MAFDDINYSPAAEKSDTNWLSGARNALTASTDGDAPAGIFLGTEPSWLGGFKLEENQSVFRDLIRFLGKDKDVEDPSPRAEAERILSEKWPNKELLKQEREEYNKALERRMLQIGIGIPFPEPGEEMKKFQSAVEKVVKQATEQVEAEMEKEGLGTALEEEKKEYEREVKTRGIQIGIGIPFPEPGKLMQQRQKRITDAVKKLAGGTASAPEEARSATPSDPVTRMGFPSADLLWNPNDRW